MDSFAFVPEHKGAIESDGDAAARWEVGLKCC